MPVTILKVVGIELTSIGRFERTSPDDEVIALEGDAGTKYRKLVISGGRIVGAILLGYAREVTPGPQRRSPAASTSRRTCRRAAPGAGACSRRNSAARSPSSWLA